MCTDAAHTGVGPLNIALRARAVRWGRALPLDSWMHRERIDVHAPAPRAAASCRADDPRGDRPNQLQELLEACEAAFDPVNGRVEARENQLAGIAMPFPVIRRKEGEVWTSESGVQLTLASTCNIHEFTALSPCCVVDILAPPYDNRAGRRCSYDQLLARPDDSLWAQPIRFDDDELFIDRSFADGTFIA